MLGSKPGGQKRSQNPLTNIGINNALGYVPPNSTVAQALRNLEDGKPTPADLAVLQGWINIGAPGVPPNDVMAVKAGMQEVAQNQLLAQIASSLAQPAIIGGSTPSVLVPAVPANVPSIVGSAPPLLDPTSTAGYPPVTTEPAHASVDVVSNDATAQEEQVRTEQFQRYLKVTNATNERIRVWVQHRSLDGSGKWKWAPATPGSDLADCYVLAPGESTYLDNDGTNVAASRVRIWAASADGGANEWLDYKEQDLWLVEELTPDGTHSYRASEMETYTFTIQ
jgi:hypothetical protein